MRRKLYLCLALVLLVIGLSGWWRLMHEVKLVGHQQSFREFVGDNPATCFHYIDPNLISYPCFGNLSQANIHVSATNQTSTYTARGTATSIDGAIQAMVDAQGQTFVLLRQAPMGDGFAGSYWLLSLRSDLSIRSAINLKGLAISQSYLMKPYQNGLLIYSTEINKAYFEPIANATKLNPGLSQNYALPGLVDKLQPIQLPPIAAGYANSSLDTSGNALVKLMTPIDGKAPTLVTVAENNSQVTYSFNGTYTKASLCGTARLCLLGKNNLAVFDITNPKPKKLYSLGGVVDAIWSDQSYVVVDKKGALKLIADQRRAYYEYRFGAYHFSAVAATTNGYVLSLTSPTNKKVALRIDETKDMSQPIDQLALKLQAFPEINALSVYKNFVFVSPKVDQSNINGGYNRQAVQAINNKIDAEIADLKINTQYYQIFNPFKSL